MPYVKNKIAVKVPHRSGFDKTHRNTGSLTCGTITPILCDELIPNSRVSLKLNLAAQLPPLVSDTYMNLKLKAEAFFVPSRLCCVSFEDWFNDFPQEFAYNSAAAGNSSVTVGTVVPRLPLCDLAHGNTSTTDVEVGPGSLLDYLGFKVNSITDDDFRINLMPVIAYHLIYQEWYRNPRVQKAPFVRPLHAVTQSSGNTMSSYLPALPFLYRNEGVSTIAGLTQSNFVISYTSKAANGTLNDGVGLFELRQRNFGLDYFTGSRLSAQQGPAVSLSVPLKTTGNTASVEDEDGNSQSVLKSSTTAGFTIASLRAANSLQQFRERNNISSPRFVEQNRARYGANLSDGVAQRPICIGAASYDVDSTGISQTAPGSGAGNPFTGVAASYGRAFASGSDFIIRDFVANEPGYLMVNITLVPECTYSTGVDRMFLRYRQSGSITDMACSLLQNVGDQPIMVTEVSSDAGDGSEGTFGYTDRFADFMFKPNGAHGQMRDGQSLDSFVLQRSFPSDSVTLSSSFLQIPKTFLDPVMAVASTTSGVSAWYDAMLQYKVSMPLAEYSIPSLQDPAYEHGSTIVLRRNGQIF